LKDERISKICVCVCVCVCAYAGVHMNLGMVLRNVLQVELLIYTGHRGEREQEVCAVVRTCAQHTRLA
jgi:hypothetical protein